MIIFQLSSECGGGTSTLIASSSFKGTAGAYRKSSTGVGKIYYVTFITSNIKGYPYEAREVLRPSSLRGGLCMILKKFAEMPFAQWKVLSP